MTDDLSFYFEIILAVSETFGGWGVQGKLADKNGVTLKYQMYKSIVLWLTVVEILQKSLKEHRSDFCKTHGDEAVPLTKMNEYLFSTDRVEAKAPFGQFSRPSLMAMECLESLPLPCVGNHKAMAPTLYGYGMK